MNRNQSMNIQNAIQTISDKNHIRFKADDYVRFYLVSIDAVGMGEYSRNFEKVTWKVCIMGKIDIHFYNMANKDSSFKRMALT